MVNPVPKFAKKIWSKWNIRGVVLVSLSLQIILIFLAPFRKRSRKNILVLLLWSTYLVADFTANFCVGLISNKYGDEDTPISTVNDFLLAFWTPFLLLHLGGPDTITAFALEDNELWLRHMFGLIVQVCLTCYVFLLTLPENTLWLPTALVFMAGIIKFAERTRSLQLASVSRFRQSMVREPDPGPNYAKLMEELKSRMDAGLPTEIVTMPEIAGQFEGINDLPEPSNSDNANQEEEVEKDDPPPNIEQRNINDLEPEKKGNNDEEVLSDVTVVKEANRYFAIFKGLVVDMIFSFHERSESRTFFLKLTALDALRVIEVELNFIYQAFYTKASVICNKVGFCFRFVSVASVVAALVLFIHDKKCGYNEFDVNVTYTLLYGAVALDIVSLLMLIFSDHSFAFFYSLAPQKIDSDDSDGGTGTSKVESGSTFGRFLNLKRPFWTKQQKVKSPTWFKEREYKILCRKLLCRRWSESISGFNLISYCILKKPHWVDYVIDYIGAKDVVEQWKYEKKQPLLQKLWIFIFTELERKSGDAEDVETIQRICSSRGEWVIQEGDIERGDLNDLMPYVERNNVTFDQCLILWHIATDLLFYEGEDARQKKNENNAPDMEKGSDDGAVPKNDEDFELRDFSKLLSDYLLYLLMMQPTMMSAVRGIGQIRFQDTCIEASNFFDKRQMIAEGEKAMAKLSTMRRQPAPNPRIARRKDMCKKFYEFIKKVLNIIWCFPIFIPFKKENRTGKSEEQEACKKLTEVCVDHDPSAVKGDRSKSLLFDACKLATVIKKLKGTNKWKIIAQVWVELLSYAASNCIPITHVQQLSKGGEFLSLVWLLMTHLGLAKQFQIKEGHARAKLIVGEEDQIKSS